MVLKAGRIPALAPVLILIGAVCGRIVFYLDTVHTAANLAACTEKRLRKTGKARVCGRGPGLFVSTAMPMRDGKPQGGDAGARAAQDECRESIRGYYGQDFVWPGYERAAGLRL
jgi:hypothetical protein